MKVFTVKIIINWDKLPRDALGRIDPTARQQIYLDLDNGLPMRSFEALKGKVIEEVTVNLYKTIVFSLRNPKAEDLSVENLTKQPELLSQEIPKTAETIMQPIDPLELKNMQQQVAAIAQHLAKKL